MKLYIMKVSLFVLLASFANTNALEGTEEPCPAFAEGETPSCESCVENNCGYAQDHGDCVNDCSTVEDTACFSLLVQADLSVADICAMAMDGAPVDGAPVDGAAVDGAPVDGAPVDGAAVDGAAVDGAPAEETSAPEETDAVPVETDTAPVETDAAAPVAGNGGCAALEGSAAPPTCETCLGSGCGWTDGSCLEDCETALFYNDEAQCVEGQTDACASSGSVNTPSASAATERMASMSFLLGATMIAAFVI